MENIDLYGDIYRCEECSRFTDPKGVMSFAGRGPNQTVPVSHFGDITTAKIWLVLTNPKGDRRDRNVGHLVSSYGAPNRASLSDSDSYRIQYYFNRYFQQPNYHRFFERYIRLLDGLEILNQHLTFHNGGICAVDVIKCPTVSDWQGYVRSDEGKAVWLNCLGRVRTPGPNYFFLRQLDCHKPVVLLFAQNTHALVGTAYKGSMNRNLMRLATNDNIPSIYLLGEKERVSVALCKTSRLNECLDSASNTEVLRRKIQNILNEVFRIC